MVPETTQLEHPTDTTTDTDMARGEIKQMSAGDRDTLLHPHPAPCDDGCDYNDYQIEISIPGESSVYEGRFRRIRGIALTWQQSGRTYLRFCAQLPMTRTPPTIDVYDALEPVAAALARSMFRFMRVQQVHVSIMPIRASTSNKTSNKTSNSASANAGLSHVKYGNKQMYEFELP